MTASKEPADDKPTKKPQVLTDKRGGIDSWSCSECGWFTHGDEQMAKDHIATKHG